MFKYLWTKHYRSLENVLHSNNVYNWTSEKKGGYQTYNLLSYQILCKSKINKDLISFTSNMEVWCYFYDLKKKKSILKGQTYSSSMTVFDNIIMQLVWHSLSPQIPHRQQKTWACMQK